MWLRAPGPPECLRGGGPGSAEFVHICAWQGMSFALVDLLVVLYLRQALCRTRAALRHSSIR
jgi:hypothetical protein